MNARQQAFRDRGLCVGCGDEVRSGVSAQTGRPYAICQYCHDQRRANQERYRDTRPVQSIDFPLTTTGAHYRVKLTGDVGKIKPCPCDDPVILEFAKGNLDFFRLRDIEITTQPVSHRKNRTQSGRPVNTINKRTIQKFYEVHTFLMGQDKPVKRATIESALGYDCARHLMDYPARWSLESAKIVKRTAINRRAHLWELTGLGRIKGVDIIQAKERE